MMAADIALPPLISPSVTETDDVGGGQGPMEPKLSRG